MALTHEQKNIIKATVPLLETGGETLTKHFYKIMLGEYAEVRPLFNQAHQSSGAQPRALASAILRYAKNIDRLEALGDLVPQIVHKHCSLQVLPEHYPIVGTCLLRAIREVLGKEIATDEVIEAWRVAYQQLADILIQKEEDVYRDIELQKGGWRGARKFVVSKKIPESSEITSFYFKPEDGKDIVKFLPGQYIGMRLVIEGEEIRRNYSLSQLYNGEEYRISVKREPHGKASNYLHDKVNVGDVIELFPPAGNFTLQKSDRTVVLISGGVGITPTLSMLEESLSTDRDIIFIHCARNAQVHAFKDWIDEVTKEKKNFKKYYLYSEDDTKYDHVSAYGYLTKDLLEEWLPKDKNADVYFLGPKPFMVNMKKFLREIGIPDSQVFYEFFGPADELESPVKEEKQDHVDVTNNSEVLAN